MARPAIPTRSKSRRSNNLRISRIPNPLFHNSFLCKNRILNRRILRLRRVAKRQIPFRRSAIHAERFFYFIGNATQFPIKQKEKRLISQPLLLLAFFYLCAAFNSSRRSWNISLSTVQSSKIFRSTSHFCRSPISLTAAIAASL